MTGDIVKMDPRYGRDADGLAALAAAFPDGDALGSEVHPELPAGAYMGGWLGGAFAFAQGMALDSPNRVVVPIIGDGECETPATAASWLARRVLADTMVLPVVHLNGHRMGGPSLLGGMSDEEVSAYARGLGWEPVVVEVGTDGGLGEHAEFHRVLVAGVEATARRAHRVVFLRCVKGWSGPIGAHKTPLTEPAGDPCQLAALRAWLSSYRPSELFDADAQPVGALASALDAIDVGSALLDAPPMPPPVAATGRGFATEVTAVLRAHAATGDIKVFSPDELRSNRLGDLQGEAWAHEVLAEEVLLGWVAGWTATGHRGLIISYEAFAPLLLTGLIGQLKQRRLIKHSLPSINLLLTSYGWHNVYSHGDPSLITALLGTGDTAVHVFTPADSDRVAVALDDALRSMGRVNVIVAGKHTTATYPGETVDEERHCGLAVWRHLSDPGEPDLTLVCAGDLAAAVVTDAVVRIRSHSGCRIRVVNVHDLTALTDPDLHHYIGTHAAVLIVTLGHPAAIWGLLGGRLHRDVDVIGWAEPSFPMSQERLAAHAGFDVAGVTSAAEALLAKRKR
ncbi:phosphoketolase family protein [Micromonospora polyrhachis]